MHDIVIIITGMVSFCLFSASSETILPVAGVRVRSLEGRSCRSAQKSVEALAPESVRPACATMLLEGELSYCKPTFIERTLFVPSSDARVDHLQKALADLEQEYDAARTESVRLYSSSIESRRDDLLAEAYFLANKCRDHIPEIMELRRALAQAQSCCTCSVM